MPNSLPAFIWFFLKKHKTAQILILAITIVASLEISFAPYILKLIIDTANRLQLQKRLKTGLVVSKCYVDHEGRNSLTKFAVIVRQFQLIG